MSTTLTYFEARQVAARMAALNGVEHTPEQWLAKSEAWVENYRSAAARAGDPLDGVTDEYICHKHRYLLAALTDLPLV